MTKRTMKCVGFLYFFLYAGTILLAQSYHITGQIIDAETREGIPFCNVIIGEGNAVYSDLDGFYELSYSNVQDSIAVSALGYASQKIALGKDKKQGHDFELFQSSIYLNEALVIAGENPANQLIRDILAHKSAHQLSAFDNYTYEKYEKLELDFVDFEPTWKEKKIMQPFAYLFEHVDTTASGRPILPIYISEELQEVRYRKSMGKEVASTIAKKNSGFQNESMVEYLQHFQEGVNVYENWIKIVNKPFASPIADFALHYYEYYIIDSTQVGKDLRYQLKFKPKRQQENTFFGTFWVDMADHAIINIELNKSTDVNLNMIDTVRIHQIFSKETGHWLPKEKEVVLNIKPTKKWPGVLAKKFTSFQAYDVHATTFIWTNTPLPTDHQAIDKTETYWQNYRHQALKPVEKQIYTMVDSLKAVKAFKTYEEIVSVLSDGTKEIGLIEIGPYYSLFTTNVIEGWRFKMGVFTSSQFSKQVRFGGFAAYGTKDKRLKYGGELKWILNDHPRIVLGASYKNDNDLNTDKDFEVSEGNMLASFLRKPIAQKLIYDKKTKIYLEKYWENGWYTRGMLMHYNMDPFGDIMPDGSGFNFAYLNEVDNMMNIDTTVTTTELSIKFRYAHQERFFDRNFSRKSLGSDYPIFTFEYTTGVKDVLESGFDYMRFDLGLSYTLPFNHIGQTDLELNGGKTVGTVPFLLMHVFRGNETHFYMPTAFNGMNRYEFAADQYVSLVANHHFDGFIMNKIPLVKKLNWRTVASFKAACGTLSRANKESNQLSYFDPNRSSFIGFRAPTNWYMETGVGIENILKVIRIEGLWRLTHLDNPEAIPFSMKLGLNFRF